MVNDSEARLLRWEQLTGVPLLICALLFLIAWSWPMIDPGLPQWLTITCNATAGVTWALVGIDYLVRLLLATNRRRYFRTNLFALLVVLFPAFGSLQIVRLLTMMSALKTRLSVRLRERVATYAIGGSLLLVWFGGIAVLAAERGAEGANIHDVGDALWWAMVTTTTVGYGDHYPVTANGKVIAVVLMICGIALMGAVTAMLTSWIVDAVASSDADQSTILLNEVRELRTEIAELREQLAAEGTGKS